LLTSRIPQTGHRVQRLTPVIQDAEAFNLAIDLMAEEARKYSPERVAAIESRGFIFGAALARELRTGFS